MRGPWFSVVLLVSFSGCLDEGAGPSEFRTPELYWPMLVEVASPHETPQLLRFTPIGTTSPATYAGVPMRAAVDAKTDEGIAYYSVPEYVMQSKAGTYMGRCLDEDFHRRILDPLEVAFRLSGQRFVDEEVLEIFGENWTVSVHREDEGVAVRLDNQGGSLGAQYRAGQESPTRVLADGTWHRIPQWVAADLIPVQTEGLSACPHAPDPQRIPLRDFATSGGGHAFGLALADAHRVLSESTQWSAMEREHGQLTFVRATIETRTEVTPTWHVNLAYATYDGWTLSGDVTVRFLLQRIPHLEATRADPDAYPPEALDRDVATLAHHLERTIIPQRSPLTRLSFDVRGVRNGLEPTFGEFSALAVVHDPSRPVDPYLAFRFDDASRIYYSGAA